MDLTRNPKKATLQAESLSSPAGVSPDAIQAWIKTESSVLHFGNRTLAIQLEMDDIKGKPVTVMLATSYAPVGNAKEHIRHAFAEDMALDAVRNLMVEHINKGFF
jgi:hypothetical protein